MVQKPMNNVFLSDISANCRQAKCENRFSNRKNEEKWKTVMPIIITLMYLLKNNESGKLQFLSYILKRKPNVFRKISSIKIKIKFTWFTASVFLLNRNVPFSRTILACNAHIVFIKTIFSGKLLHLLVIGMHQAAAIITRVHNVHIWRQWPFLGGLEVHKHKKTQQKPH